MTPHDWAIALAEEVAPEELELAPIWVDAYLQGGQARRELFAEEDSVAGGFGGINLAVILPAIFAAIVKTHSMLQAVLSHPQLLENLKMVNTSLDIIRLREKIRDRDKKTSTPATGHDRVAETCIAFVEELHRCGVRQLDCEGVAFRVVKRLALNPSEARQFIERLQNSGS